MADGLSSDNQLIEVVFLGERPTLGQYPFSINLALSTFIYCEGQDGWQVNHIFNGTHKIVPVSVICNVALDTDLDGVEDAKDAFPFDPGETRDSDSDGVGDNADVFANDPTETVDTDNDGIGDNADTDDDGDGIVDSLDAYPLDPTNQPIQLLDVDDNGQADALTDSLLITRYMFGFRGEALIDGAVGEGATRTSSEEIEAYLEALIPEL